MVQDGPPPGGFPSVRIARRIPSTGPGGFTLFAVSASIMAYGFYLVRAQVAQRPLYGPSMGLRSCSRVWGFTVSWVMATW